MDRQKALQIFETIRKRDFAGWKIIEFQDNGKSAAVFRASRGNQIAAVKIFDTELIDKFGDTTLLARVEREAILLDHSHPNLVRMLGAGIEDRTGFHFLAMEFLPGQSLANCVDQIPNDYIEIIIQQVASAAEFLETIGLAHRDIKPANILISPDHSEATLLDLGVLRPVGEAGLTDNGGPTLFVGTNQYASPEFALRKEEDSLEGWRAVTFYQLGAVLHDLITRTQLFEQHLGVPARLAHAVQAEVVEIRSNSIAPWLVTLAQNCLVKSPETRLRLVSWDSFKAKAPRRDLALELRERIRQRAAAAATVIDERKRYGQPPQDPSAGLRLQANRLLQEILRNFGRNDPPLGRRIVFEIGEKRVVRCDFEPSEALSLSAGFTVCLLVEAADSQSRVVRILSCHNTTAPANDWCPTDLDPIYEGRLDKDEIEEAVALFILTKIDEAQAPAGDI